MNDAQLLRYSRHILLDEIGIEGQQRLLAAHVLVIGAGGLGCAAGLYLGSAGVGQITVADDDRVDATNLQRQIAHTTDRVGQYKAGSLATAIGQINPEVRVHAWVQRATNQNLPQWVAAADVVLDCSDNFATRQAINRACVQARKPLVSGAALRMDGQLAVFDSRVAQSPCYACVFDPRQPPVQAQCATMGVLAPLVGIVGAMQASEAIKLLTGMGSGLAGHLLLIDGLHMDTQRIALRPEAHCPVCAAHAPR